MRQTSWSSAARERCASGASAVMTEAPGVLTRTLCHAVSSLDAHLRTDTHRDVDALVDELDVCCHRRGEPLHTVPSFPHGNHE
eukprot:1843028-Pleurochrysis_carterae.AAC.2